MFAGIIKNTGKIHRVYKRKNNCIIEILSKMKFVNNEIGSSISCSGVCLTLDNLNKKKSIFYVSKETLKRSTFKKTSKGDIVNLEKSLRYGERISGHYVQGHVDTTAVVKKINVIGKSWLIYFTIRKEYKKYIIYKGSIAINGVSLTIAKIYSDGFEISVIPKTLKTTNLINLKKRDLVNIEFDVLGKYIKNFIK